MKQALVNHLLAAAGLTALVGQRISWVTRPQASQLPSVSLQKISGNPIYVDEGESGLSRTRIQIDAWGADFDSADQVAQQIHIRLSGAAFTRDGVTFRLSHKDNERDNVEQGAGGEVFYVVRQDFFILWK